MPLIFAENEATESGISYEDRTGVSYQYPKMYRRIIQPGERFIYYRGRKRRGGGRAPQVYFGTGVVGTIHPDGERLVCEILDHHQFSRPVPFKNEADRYYESGAERKGYFQRGVRTVSDQDFQNILAAAEIIDALPEREPATAARKLRSSLSYASPETIARIEAFATQVAIEELRRCYPKARIEVQPRNNPGFDVLVCEGTDTIYVEVKGTTRPVPDFFMTQGEVQFSRREESRYRLLVVYAIEELGYSYKVFCHEGPISEKQFELRPVQWLCRPSLYNDIELFR